MILFIIMTCCIINVFWLTMLGITSLGGNKFVNGILLGSAEMSAGVFSGCLIYYSSPRIAFQTCAILGMGCNALTLFFVPAGSLVSYFTVFITILGIRGLYTCLFVLIPIVIPKE